MTSRTPLSRLAAASLALVSGAIVGAIALAPAAHAADGRISQIDATATSLRVVFGADSMPAGATLDPASVKVSAGGTPLVATAVPYGQTAAPVRRSILVMDVSESMKGAGIAGARSAAASYVAALPADVAVGVVTFASKARVLIAPTTDRAAVLAAVKGLDVVVNGGTALYAGTVLGNTTAGSTGVRNLLVLSDGADDGTSPVKAPQALAAVKASGVTLDAVSLGKDAAQVASLKALAAAGNGTVVTLDGVAGIDAVFESAAQSVSNQLVITAPLPAELARGSQAVSVSAVAAGTTVSDQAEALLPAAAAAAPADTAAQFGAQPVPVSAREFPGWVLPAALAALFLGLLGILAIAFMGSRSDDAERGRVRRRLSKYSLAPRPTEEAAIATAASSGALGNSTVARTAVEFAGRVTSSRDVDTALGLKLDAAGVPIKPAEWTLIHIGLTLGLGLLFMALSGIGLFATLLGLIIGFSLPYLYLSYRSHARRKEFSDVLPDTLQLLAGSLSAGYSLPQAVDTVSRESQGVMASELNRAIVEARLGVPLDEALDNVAARMQSKDFSWVVMALRINRDVGGNLSEVLTNVAATMRERERLRRQVQALSAEGRLSAIVLGALPVLFALYLALVRPEYIGKLFASPLGLAMVVVGLGLLLAGFAWLRAVIRVEV